jgi:hypothetical protein
MPRFVTNTSARGNLRDVIILWTSPQLVKKRHYTNYGLGFDRRRTTVIADRMGMAVRKGRELSRLPHLPSWVRASYHRASSTRLLTPILS